MSPPFDSWASDHPPAPDNISSSLPHSAAPQNKKPRHRHSPHQLAALNQLFDQNEHPSLEQRSALAERLGMETKTVNAWFQNKRASSKKRVRGSAHLPTHEPQPVNAPPPVSAHNPPPPPPPVSHDFYRHSDYDDYHDDDYSSVDIHHSRSASVIAPEYSSTFYTGLPDPAHFYTASDNIPRKMRMRPSSEQAEELKKLYHINPHPTTEQRQALSASIGMPYQSITNWFQNQRSLAKKKKEDEPDHLSLAAPRADYPQETRQYSAFPPPSHPRPSSHLPPPTTHPSLVSASGALLRRSPSVSPPMEELSPRRSAVRRSTTPYGSVPSTFVRPRRSRPEPYQLDALKELFTKTPTPTIEERSALALEIGMELGKVTNWFRNLRQTARKRAKKSGSGDDEDDDMFSGRDPYSTSASRSATPSFGSSSSSLNDDSMDLDDFDMHNAHSDNVSEDEYQEAVTPSPEHSPSPPPAPVVHTRNDYPSIEAHYSAQTEKIPTKHYSGARIEDALLLLSFHNHVVH